MTYGDDFPISSLEWPLVSHACTWPGMISAGVDPGNAEQDKRYLEVAIETESVSRASEKALNCLLFGFEDFICHHL